MSTRPKYFLHRTEQVRFFDGTLWDRAAILSRVATYTDNADVIVGTVLNDILRGGGGGDRIDGAAGNDMLFGDDGDDIVNGGDGDDQITGGNGSDQLDGGNGDDIFLVGQSGGVDGVEGGYGINSIQAVTDNVEIGLSAIANVRAINSNGFINVSVVGTQADDTLNFGSTALIGIAKIDGKGGNDTITGSIGSDVILGGLGDDTLIGSIDNDVFARTGGLKAIVGASTESEANLVTVYGNDIIVGGTGNDILIGSLGDDVFQVSGTSDGFDTVDGGVGSDTISATSSQAVIGLHSLNSVEAITAGGFSGVSISGSVLGDTLNFSSVILTGIIRIDGGAGNDIITGTEAGANLAGGAGNDTLTGGAGNDVFLFADVADGFDTISGGAGTDVIQATNANTVIGLAAITGIETITSAGFAGVTVSGTAQSDTLDFRPEIEHIESFGIPKRQIF